MDYEATLKKLINILKFKSSDNLKQIDELWNAFVSGKPNILNNNNGSGGGGVIASQNVKLEENENSNDSNTSSSKSATIKRSSSNLENLKNNKKQKIIQTSSPPPPLNQNQMKTIDEAPQQQFKEELEDNISSSSSTSSHLSHVSLSNPNTSGDSSSKIEFYDNEEENEEQPMDVVVSGVSNQINNIDEYVIEMGLTCDICKLLVQEQNNKLAECQECKRLYHQQCHKPIITNEEIHDPRMVWYCAKCNKSLKSQFKQSNNKKQNNESNGTTSNSFSKANNFYKRQNSSNEIQENNNNTNQLQAQFSSATSILTSPTSDKFFLNDNEQLNGNGDQQKLYFKRDPKVIQTNEKSSETLNGGKAVKGLAALVTKFGTNPITNGNGNNLNIKSDDLQKKLQIKPSSNTLDAKNLLNKSNSQNNLQANKSLKSTSSPLNISNKFSSPSFTSSSSSNKSNLTSTPLIANSNEKAKQNQFLKTNNNKSKIS